MAESQSDRFFFAIAAASRDAMFVLDGNARVLYANAAAPALFACSHAELLESDLSRFLAFSGDRGQSIARLLEDLPGNIAGRLTRPDGGVLDVEVGVVRTDTPDQFVLTVRDVTRRKSVEKALKASEDRLSTALAVGRMGVYDNNLLTSTIWWSEDMYRIFGVDPQTFRPSRTSFRSLVHPLDLTALFDHRQATIDEHEPLVHEFRVIRPDGLIRWVSNRARTEYDEDGKAIRHFGVAQDITDRKSTEDALREQASLLNQADVRKNEFLAMLAHELRGPLAPIRNVAHALQLTKEPAPALMKAGQIIDRQVLHLARLVEDLLDVARVSTGKVRLRIERSDLNGVLEQAIEMSQPSIEARQHRLDVHLSEQAVFVEGDPTRLVQIVCNLLDNAAKYTPQSGHITLRLVTSDTEDGPQAVISVADNGRGITPLALDNLFDLFFQGDRNIDRAEGGLGIGLSLVKNLVQMHGGEIEAQSAGPSQGSEFIVRLPIAQTGTPTKKEDSSGQRYAVADEPAAGPCRILVVDDNVDTAESLALVLSLEGCETRTAHDGESAIASALGWRPDMVLLDLGLPTIDGYTACQTMRRKGLTAATIIAITGYGEAESRQRSKAAGFDAHLVKPISASALDPYLRAVRALQR